MSKKSNRVFAPALLLLGTASTFSIAQAQTVDTPERAVIDANGVNVATGKYRVERVDLVIGSGAGTLQVKRLSGQSVYEYAYVNLATILTVGGKVKVNVGEKSFLFNHGSGNSFQTALGDGAKLTRLADSLTLTESNGVVYSFRDIFTPDEDDPNQRSVYLSEISYPNGKKIIIYWDIAEYTECRENWADPSFCPYENGYSDYKHFRQIRLSGLANSASLAVNFVYAEPFLWGAGAIPAWHDNIGVTSANDLSIADPMPSVSIASSVQYLPNGDGRQIQDVTDAMGRTTRYTREGNLTSRYEAVRDPGSPVDNLRVYSDSASRVTSIVKNGATWTYSYAEPVSNISTLDVTDPAGHTRRYRSNRAVGLPTQVEDEYGRITQYEYDQSGRLINILTPDGQSISYGYDSRGNVTTTAMTGSGGVGSLTSTATYPQGCSSGVTCNLPTSTADARGIITNYSYDAVHGGLLSTTVQNPNPNLPSASVQTRYAQVSGVWLPTKQWSCRTLSSCENSSDAVQTTVSYNGNLLPTAVTHGAGDGSLTATTNLTYTSAGDVSTADGPLAGAADTTRHFYNVDRQLTSSITADPDGAGALRSLGTAFHYDAAGRVDLQEIGSANADGSGFVSAQQLAIQYDGASRKVRETLMSGGAAYGVTQYAYDAFDRATCVAVRMDPAQWASQTDACMPQTNGGNGPDRVTRSEYFDDGRLKKVTQAYGTADVTNESLTYTPGGNVQTFTDGNNNVTTKAYDGFGRLLTTTFSDNSYEQLTYDANGNVTSRRLRDNQTIGQSYDELNRPVTRTTPKAVYWETDKNYVYDLTGALKQASDSYGRVLTFSHDALGRRIAQGDNWYAAGNASYQYDAAGRRTRLTWFDGQYATYEYDAAGNVTVIRENGGLALASFGYDALGRRTSLTRGNGTVTSYGYDAVSRLSSLTQDLAGGAWDQGIGLTYNPAGQIASRTASNDAYAWTGHYNVDRPYGVNGLNQLTSAGSVALGYDGRGNLTSSGGQAYGYTSENRLATAPGANLAHDPLDRLFNVNAENGVNTTLAYDGADVLAEVDQSNGALLRRYVYGPGTDEPLLWYEGAGLGDRRWLHADERGSVIAVSDGSGNASAINRYDEYGIPQSGNIGRFQYTGQKWLPSIGMYDYKARMYSPTLGRFLQTDPIGYADGLNWYNYVGSDPVNASDPSGLVTQQFVNCAPAATSWNSSGGDIVGTTTRCETIWIDIPDYRGGRSGTDLIRPGGGGTRAQVGNTATQSAHYYSNRSRVIPCAASDAQIADLARRFAAPGQPAGPISNGQRSIASTPVGSGPVRSTYYSYGNYGTSVITTLNVTLPGHPLYNGSVTRDWFRGADGAVWVETVGRGTNSSDFIAGANSIAGPPIFRGVDADAAAYAAKNICGRQ